MSGLVWLHALTAFAQATPDTATEEQKRAALEAYSEGRMRYEAGDYAGALEHFARSQAWVLSPNTRLMYARCLVQLGRKAEAYEALGEVSGLTGGDSTKYRGAIDAAEIESTVLRGSLAQLTVEVQGEASFLTVGGRVIERERWGQPLAVEPGLVEVVAVGAAGEQRQKVGIGPREIQTVQVVMRAVASQRAAVDSASAEPPGDRHDHGPSPVESRANPGLLIGGKVGAGLGKPFSDFGATPVFELELGCMLPALHRSIEIFVTGQYAQPALEGESEEADPRVPGGEPLKYDVKQQWFALSLGALYRIDLGSDVVMPYGGLGARLYTLRTTVEGSVAGQRIGENTERQMELGVVLLVGIDIFLGPGALLAELSLGWAELDAFVMRDTTLGALSLSTGYRVML